MCGGDADRGSKLGDRAKASIANLHGVLYTAEGAVKEVDTAAADIQAALGLTTNGGPPLKDGETPKPVPASPKP